MGKESSSSLGYPSEFCSSTEKLTDKWALQYVRAAWEEMQSNKHFKIEDRQSRFKMLRETREGLNDLSDVIKTYTQDQDMSHSLIDYGVSTPLPKMATIATRTVYNRPYKPKAVPVDSMSVSKMGNRRNELLHAMKMEAMRLEMEENGVNGVIPPSGEELPKDKNDLEVHMIMNPKIGESSAYEYLIRQGFKQNSFHKIQEKIAKDLVDLKMCATRTHFDSDNNLIIDYVDPIRLISSFVEKDDFSDSNHLGQVTDVSISVLREMMGDKYDERELQWIAQNATKPNRGGWNFGDPKYYDTAIAREEYNENKVQLVHLQVKQYDRVTYIKKGKVNGGFRVEKKSYDYVTPKHAKREREVKHKGAQSIYDGYWVVGTDYVFDWHRKEDSFRDRVDGKWSNTSKFDYVVIAPDIYDMQNKSLVEKASYRNKQLINLTLKAQQFLIQADPPTTAYDVDSMNNAIAGMGFGDMKPIEMANIKTQTGRYFYSSRSEGDESLLTHSLPIQKVDSGIDQSIMILAELYNIELARMRDDLGIPEAVGGGEMDKKALVGIQQLATEGHKSAMADLISAYDFITEQTAQRVYTGLQYQIINKVNLKELEASLGELNIKEVSLTEISKADFAIGIEMLPDQFEIEIINQDLQRLAESGQIAPEDKYSVMRVAKENTKRAEALLSFLTKKFRNEQQQAKNESIQLQSQGNIQAAQATAQAESQNIQLKYNLENQNKQAEIQAEIEKAKKDLENKLVFLTAETASKEQLIEKSAEVNAKAEKEAQKNETINEKASRGGYDPKKDSMPKEAGRLEAGIYPSDLNVKQKITS
jgi:hypothetical protein